MYARALILTAALTVPVSAFAAIEIEHLALGGLYPGMQISAAEKIFGSLKFDAKREEAVLSPGFELEIDERAPTVIESLCLIKEGPIKTARGLGIGSLEDDIIKIYGQPDQIEREDDGNEYLYLSDTGNVAMEFETAGGRIVKISSELKD